MEEKEKILAQLDNIQSTLIDKEKFMPFNYRVLIMWGIVSALVLLTFEYISSFGLWYAIVYTGIIITLGFFVEIYFTKKENKKYDMSKFTSLQKFVEANYTFAIIISIALTYLFVLNNLGVYSYIVWMFMLGYADFVTGFVINTKKFTTTGLINISVSIAITTITFIFTPLIVEAYIKYVAIFFISGSFIYNGLMLKRGCKIV